MSDTKHTPSPWEWKWEEKDLGWFNQGASPVLRGPDGKAIIEGFSPYEEGGIRSDYSQEVAERNAHLIAAAPDLLEACKFAHITALQTIKVDHELTDMLYSVIAKAEGRR